jgi:transcriptional regulator with XRE-family HTH domain
LKLYTHIKLLFNCAKKFNTFMNLSITDAAPTRSETLGRYVQRIREALSLTQLELSIKAGIHVQTIRKIESGATSRLSQKGKSGLAAALQLPQEYLDAVTKQTPVEVVSALKFCPQCWVPGTTLTVENHISSKFIEKKWNKKLDTFIKTYAEECISILNRTIK